MAAVLADSAEGLIRTSNIVQPNTDYTISGWFYLANIPAAGTWRTLFYLHDLGEVNYVWIGHDHTTSEIEISVNGTAFFTPAVATPGWHYITYRRIVATNRHEVYVDGALGAFRTQNLSAVTFTRQYVGTDTLALDWDPSKIAYLRDWNNDLAVDEIFQEMRSATVVRLTNLWADAPLAASLNDESGSGRHWAASGGSITFDGQPVLPTRYYFTTRSPGAFIEGNSGGDWDFFGGGPGPNDLACFTWELSTSKTNAGGVTARSQSVNQQPNYDTPMLGRWCSRPLAAQTIDGLVDLCFRVQARWSDGILGFSNDSIVRYKVHIYVTVGDSTTVRGTLLNNYLDTQNFPGTSGGEWRQLIWPQALSPVAIQDGDRVMVEVGFRVVSAPVPSVTYPADDWTQIDWRSTGASAANNDAVNGESSTSRNAWIQFSAQLTEQALPAAPANDACADAVVIGALPYVSPRIDTTQSADTNRRVWYTFTPAQSGEIFITTFGSNYRTAIDVFTGGCGALSFANYGTRVEFGVGRSASVCLLNVTAGTQYWIRVGTNANSESATLSGGSLRLTVGYRQTPQPDDLYIPTSGLFVFREGVLINANPSLFDFEPTGIAIDYTQRSLANTGGSPGGSPHTGYRVYLGLFSAGNTIEIVDLPTLSYVIPGGGTDLDIILDPWDLTVPQPHTPQCGAAYLHLTRAGLLVTQWFGNGFLYVSGLGTSRPAFLSTVASDTSFSAIKTIDAAKGDNQVGAPFADTRYIPTLESTAAWGGALHELTGNLYYVSGSPYDCPLVASQQIRIFNVLTGTQGPTFATLPTLAISHPAARGLSIILGAGGVFGGLLATNGNTVVRLGTDGSIVSTFTPSTPDPNAHIGLMDVKILSDGLHAWTIDYTSRRIWKFAIATMTEVATYPTYLLGPFLQLALFQPDGQGETPPYGVGAAACPHPVPAAVSGQSACATPLPGVN